MVYVDVRCSENIYKNVGCKTAVFDPIENFLSSALGWLPFIPGCGSGYFLSDPDPRFLFV